MLYSFLFASKLFPKRVVIYQEKATLKSTYFLENYDWRVDISL